MLVPLHRAAPRRLDVAPGRTPGPQRAVWEITWRCDLRCPHCLVEGGPAGRPELTTAEGLELIDGLAALGTRIVTLTGGEPLLRRDWPRLAARVVERGMELRLSTNGHLLDRAVLAQLVDLGCEAVVVSIDGLAETHDRIRVGPGTGRRKRSSHDQVLDALDLLAPSPIRSSVITAVHQANLPELPRIHEELKAHRVQSWQVQLAHATGRARRHVLDGALQGLLRPDELPTLVAFLVQAVRDPLLPPRVHNSIGYLGRNEPLLRAAGRARGQSFWQGCRCGATSIAIEPDGGLKGCASQVGAPFVVGNVTREPLQLVWDDRPRWHWLRPAPSQITGDCAPCALKSICGAGCTALAYAASGELFDNPYCERRADDRAAAAGGAMPP